MAGHNEVQMGQERQTERAADLSEETDYIVQRAQGLLDRAENLTLPLDGLYAVIPGRQASGKRVVDNGCRGGWVENYTLTLTDDVVPVCSLGVLGKNITLKFAGGAKTLLSPADLGDVRFLVDRDVWSPEAPSSALNTALHARLTTGLYRALTSADAEALTDWRHITRVRSQSPLERPITFRGKDSGYYREHTLLDSAFERVDAAYDVETDTTLAQVVVSTDEFGGMIATDWVPLDQLNFYESDAAEYAAYRWYAGKLALALIEGATDTAAINQLLREVPSRYIVKRRRLDEPSSRTRVVTGRYSSGSIIDVRPTHVQDPEYLEAITIGAAEVIYDHAAPWVIDESGLAVPLSRADGFRNIGSHSSGLSERSLTALIAAAKQAADN